MFFSCFVESCFYLLSSCFLSFSLLPVLLLYLLFCLLLFFILFIVYCYFLTTYICAILCSTECESFNGYDYNYIMIIHVYIYIHIVLPHPARKWRKVSRQFEGSFGLLNPVGVGRARTDPCHRGCVWIVRVICIVFCLYLE